MGTGVALAARYRGISRYQVRSLEEANAELIAEYDYYLEVAGEGTASAFCDAVRAKVSRISVATPRRTALPWAPIL